PASRRSGAARSCGLYATASFILPATPDHPGPYDAGMRLCDVLGLRWSLTHGVLEENGGTRSLNRNLLARMALPAAAMLLALFQVCLHNGPEMATIHLPTALRKYCGGAADLPVSATTVRAALEELERSHPSPHRHLCDE